MKVKLGLFFVLISLYLVGCQGTSFKVVCKPSSELTSSADTGKLKLSWNYGNEKDLIGYRIYYGTSSQKYTNCVDIGKPAESSPGVIEYLLSGLVTGKQYYIAVVAVGKNNQQSNFSTGVSGVAK